MTPRSLFSKADIRQGILDSALHEFSQKGYHRAILDEIASRAGVSKGAIYWHFDNKRALLLAAARRETSRFFQYLEAVLSEDGRSVAERLEMFIVTALTYYTDHPDFCNLLKVLSLPGSPELDQDIESLMIEMYRQAREMAASLLQAGVVVGEIDPDRARVAEPMLVALLDGLMFQWIMDREAVPVREMAPVVARAFLEGIIRPAK